MTRWPSPEYEVTTEFQAPLPFVFRWCTDYSPKDASLEKENYQRRILSRSAKQVVYEDLESDDEGWIWRRYTVTLRPPDQWHAESVGNRRLIMVDYQLTELPDGRTRLHYTWRRKGLMGYTRNPPKRQAERESAEAWRNFGRALERDYRSSRKG
jgi:hypothetical protein